MTPQQLTQDQLVAMLAWQVEMGANEALLDNPSKFATTNSGRVDSSTPIRTQQQSPQPVTLGHINNLPDLANALGQLDSCPLKHTASNMCFSDGNAGSRLMIIGEAPGRDEDRMGVPFVGAAGQFLDQMLASIGLDRSGVYLANFLPWRPPGNRAATPEEIEMLLPFLYRHIQLANPELVIILGGTPAKTMLQSGDSILKLRGRWQNRDFGDGMTRPTMASLHPAYLMRSPAQKRLAFYDWCGLYYRLNNQLDNKSPLVNA